MLVNVINAKQLAFNKVLLNSWDASQRLMRLIDNLGKIDYFPLKVNRLVDDSEGIEKYKRVNQLAWNQGELEARNLIKINKFPFL